MVTNRRRQLIEQRLRSGPAESQQEIARALKSHGIRTTQATISRDLVALGALKGPSGYFLGDEPPPPEAAGEVVDRAVAEHALSVVAADSIVVIRTSPGHANLLGAVIDRRPPDGVAGCIAGDDTLFLATMSAATARRVAAAIARAQRAG